MLGLLLLSLPPHPRRRAADTALGDAVESEVVYAMHKPRGVVSKVQAPSPYQRTLTDVMEDAGVPPIPGHVGRLDAETSGLLLLTTHSLLLRSLVGQPEVLDAYGGAAVGKVYRLLLAGRHARGDGAIASLQEPLAFERSERVIRADSARLLRLRTFRHDAIASGEYKLLGRAEGAALDEERAALRAARAAPVVVRSSGATRAPHVPDGGWLTYVDLEIRQGRHHQIRRLCRRAGLKLRHLKRLSVGPVALGSLPPGGVRELGRDEREALYARCLPQLREAQLERLRTAG